MGKQKRSENTYTKINTIFLRDKNNIIMPYDELVAPEFEWLRNCKFDADEKIDGTNIRIEVTRQVEDNAIIWSVVFKGKTDTATIPPKLDKYLKDTFTEDKVLNAIGLSKKMIILDEHGNVPTDKDNKKVFAAKKGECDGKPQYIEYPLPAYGVAVFRFNYAKPKPKEEKPAKETASKKTTVKKAPAKKTKAE